MLVYYLGYNNWNYSNVSNTLSIKASDDWDAKWRIHWTRKHRLTKYARAEIAMRKNFKVDHYSREKKGIDRSMCNIKDCAHHQSTVEPDLRSQPTLKFNYGYAFEPSLSIVEQMPCFLRHVRDSWERINTGLIFEYLLITFRSSALQ